jgi:hypothetical protein
MNGVLVRQKNDVIKNEIYASLSSYSRVGTVDSIKIKINQYVDKYIKRDILLLSKTKINEFIKANEIVESLKIKYKKQEKTLTELLLYKRLNN